MYLFGVLLIRMGVVVLGGYNVRRTPFPEYKLGRVCKLACSKSIYGSFATSGGTNCSFHKSWDAAIYSNPACSQGCC